MKPFGASPLRIMAIAAGLAAGTPVPTTVAAAAGPSVDWPTYGFDVLRTGFNPYETSLSADSVPQMSLAWAFSPALTEAAIDPTAAPVNATFQAQPVVAAGVLVNGISTDLVIAGDNNGTLFALDAHSADPAGSVVWASSLGRGAAPGVGGVIDVIGIRSAAAIDRFANGGSGAVYVGLNGRVHALDLATGVELAGWPVWLPGPYLPTDDGFIHDGINIVNGQLYVGTSSEQDRPPWYGKLVRIDTTAAAVSGLWYTLSGNAWPPLAGVSGGGIWGGGGVAIDPTATVGGVYFGTGNASTLPNSRWFAEYVMNLSPDLSQVVSFASPIIPSGDFDYGSTPTLFQPTVCPNKMLAIKNKSGLLVIEAIAPDGTLSVLQSIPVADSVNFVGSAAWDWADQLLFITSPNVGPPPFLPGLLAFQALPDCSGFSLAWQTSANAQGVPFEIGFMSSPTVANGVVYFGASGNPAQVLGVSTHAGPFYGPGQVMWQSPLRSNCRRMHPLSAPTVANGWLYVPCIGPSATLQAFTLQ